MLDTKGHRPPEAMMGPEAMARELARAESIEVPAQDAHDLIEATEDAIEELEIKFARNDQALEQLTMLSDRVLFYLEKDGEPTPFAEALLTDSDDRTINQELAVVQISQIITSEVNPILFKLREAIKSKDTRSQAGGDAEEEHSLDDVESLDPIDTSPELEHDPLALGDELVPALKSGKVENQVTTTLFGALEGLSDTEKHVAKELIILNPLALDQDNVDYWSTQMSAHKEVTGEKVENYAELIAGRSVRAVYELDTLAERLGTKQYEADSITALAQFINNKIDLLEGDFENAAKELSFFDHDRLGMTGDEVIDLLNAAEVLKKEDPQLYARLLGIAPGRKKAESQRSDLFGNVFQIALDASQKDPKRQNKYKNKAGQEIVDKYIDGLTKIESHQLPLNYLNEQQLNILQQRLTLEMTKEDGKPNEFLVINLMSKINLAKRSDEARKFLEGLNEAVDEEGKERMKFKQDMEWIQEFRKDISLQAKEKMAVNTSLAKAFVARKEYSKAGGHIRKAVGFHMRDIDAMVLQNSFLIFMLTNILPQIPDKDLLANPDAIIKDLSGAMYTSDFTPYIVERYLEAGDPMEAFAYFSNLELTSGSQRLRELFADVPEKMAEELEAIGLHEEARSLLNDPNLFDVRVVEVEGRTDKKEVVQEYLNEGLISEAERVIASIDDKNEKEAAKDLIFNKFIEVGDFERAQRYTSRFHSYERSFGRFTELLLAKKEAGENIDVEVRQYLESIKFDEEKYKKGRASWFGGRDTEQVKGEKIQYGKFESRIKKLYFKDKMGEDVDTQMRNLLAGIEHAKVGRDMTVDMYLDLLPLADDESSPLTLSEINYELGAKLYEFSSSGKSISPESKQKIIKSYCDNGGYVEALSFAHRFDIGFKTVARAAMEVGDTTNALAALKRTEFAHTASMYRELTAEALTNSDYKLAWTITDAMPESPYVAQIARAERRKEILEEVVENYSPEQIIDDVETLKEWFDKMAKDQRGEIVVSRLYEQFVLKVLDAGNVDLAWELAKSMEDDEMRNQIIRRKIEQISPHDAEAHVDEIESWLDTLKSDEDFVDIATPYFYKLIEGNNRRAKFMDGSLMWREGGLLGRIAARTNSETYWSLYMDAVEMAWQDLSGDERNDPKSFQKLIDREVTDADQINAFSRFAAIEGQKEDGEKEARKWIQRAERILRSGWSDLEEDEQIEAARSISMAYAKLGQTKQALDFLDKVHDDPHKRGMFAGMRFLKDRSGIFVDIIKEFSKQQIAKAQG